MVIAVALQVIEENVGDGMIAVPAVLGCALEAPVGHLLAEQAIGSR